MSLRILLADDHEIVRSGLRALLEKQDDIQVVAEADNGRDAVRLARELKPTVVVMDVSMPDLNGVEATRQILKRRPEVKIVALSMHSDRRFVAEMLKAGARAYLLKDCAYDELVGAIRTVTGGRAYLSPAIVGIAVESLVHGTTSAESPVSTVLSARQREVLQLVAEGLASKQIAARLHVSTKTVETHRQQIMERLDLHSVADLTKFAVREGLTSLES